MLQFKESIKFQIILYNESYQALVFFNIQMWSQVDAKRNKFANQIRKRQHEQYFEMHRQMNASQLPASAYLPILIKNQQYQDIEMILDCIEIEDSQQQLDPKIISIIHERFQYHSNSKIRNLMLKLLNRLKLWECKHVNKAIIYLIEDGHLDMIKQLALYLNIKKMQVQNQNASEHSIIQQTKLKKISIQEFRSDQIRIFEAIIDLKITNPQYRLFWLDIISQAFLYSVKSQLLVNHIKDMDNFIYTLDFVQTDLTSENLRQQQLSQIIHILHKLTGDPIIHKKIILMQCFSSIVQFIFNGSIQIVIEGLELLAQLMSVDQVLIAQLINRYKILKILDKYINHVMIAVQIRVLWAFSNILASEHYKLVYQQKSILAKLYSKLNISVQPEIRIEIYCCILNLVCNSNAVELEQLCTNKNTVQIIIDALEWTCEQCMKNILLQRVVFAVYHLITEFPKSWVMLDQYGAKKTLTKLYDEEKEEKKLNMLNSLLDLVEKQKKQHTVI